MDCLLLRGKLPKGMDLSLPHSLMYLPTRHIVGILYLWMDGCVHPGDCRAGEPPWSLRTKGENLQICISWHSAATCSLGQLSEHSPGWNSEPHQSPHTGGVQSCSWTNTAKCTRRHHHTPGTTVQCFSINTCRGEVLFQVR